MSDNTKKKELSRLELVRQGKVDGYVPSMSRRRMGRTTVDIVSLIPDPSNERKTFNDIEDLAKSIEAVGIVEPPTVIPAEEEGKFIITTGHRRWTAAKKAGLKQITVIVNEPEDETKRRQKSLISNIQRSDLSAMEVAQALQSMKEDREDVSSNQDLANLIGKSRPWVSSMINLTKLPASTQQKIAKAEKPIAYDTVIEISKMGNEESRDKLVNMALCGASVRDIKSTVQKIKEKEQPNKKPKSKKPVPYSVECEGEREVRIMFQKHRIPKEQRVALLKDALKEAIAIERGKGGA